MFIYSSHSFLFNVYNVTDRIAPTVMQFMNFFSYRCTYIIHISINDFIPIINTTNNNYDLLLC